MGGDGGSVPGRAEMVHLVDTYVGGSKVRNNEMRRWRLSTCAISGLPLVQGEILGCKKGFLYLRKPLLEYLADDDRPEYPGLEHLNSLKAVKPVILEGSIDEPTCAISGKSLISSGAMWDWSASKRVLVSKECGLDLLNPINICEVSITINDL